MAKQNDKDKKSILEQYFSEAEILNMDEKMRKSIERQLKSLSKLDDFAKRQKTVWDSITQSFLNLNLSDFQSKLKISEVDLAKMNIKLKDQQEILKDNAKTLKNDWQDALAGVEMSLYNLSKTSGSISSNMASALQEAIKSGDIGKFLQEQGAAGRQAIQDLVKDQKGFDALRKFLESDGTKGFQQLTAGIKNMEAALAKNGQTVFDIQKGLMAIGANLTKAFSPDKVKATLMDFDNIINHTQRDFGIEMDKNSAKYTELITQSARFGMTAKENAQFMGSLAEGIQNTNYDLLAGAAKDMMAVQRATGLTSEGVNDLTKQMMYYGTSSKDVATFTEDTMNKSLKAGLSTKKVLGEFTKMIPTAKALGWAGGAAALRDMVIQAEKLGQNIEGIAAASKKLRSLEGALEASADLALLGVNTNALQLMGTARKGTKEFSTMLADMTAGLGHLKKGSNEIEFSGLDIDLLQGISDATGQTIEDLQKQITKSTQLNAKNKLLPSSFFNLDKDQKQFLLDATKLNEQGQLELSGSIMGVNDLKKISPEMIKAAMAQTKTLEQYADKNKSFEDSVSGLKASIINMTTFIQPLIAWVTGLVQGFNKWFSESNLLVKGLVAGVATMGAIFFSVSKNFFSGYTMGLGFNAATTKGGFLKSLGSILNPMNWKKQLFGGGGAAMPAAATRNPITGFGANLGTTGTNQATGVSKLSQALNSMPRPQKLLALSAALVAFGFAMVEIGYGIKVAAEGLGVLVKSFDGISNSMAALGAVAAVMGGFIGIIWAMVPAISALSTVSTTGVVGLLALGATFVGIGYGIKLASEGLSNLVTSFSLLGSSASASLGAMISVMAVMNGFTGMMYAMAPAIRALGTVSTAGVIGLLALGAAFVGIGFGIKLASDGLSNLVTSFSSLGNSIFASLGAVITIEATMAGFTGIMYAMVPAIEALGMAGSFGSLGLLAIGAAFVGIGYGIKLASEGITQIVGAFNNANSSMAPLMDMVTKSVFPIIAFSSALFSLIPAVAGLGAVGIASAFGIAAVGASMNYLGSGLEKTGSSLTVIKDAFKDIIPDLQALGILPIVFTSLSQSLSNFSFNVPSFNNMFNVVKSSINDFVKYLDNLPSMDNAFNNITKSMDSFLSNLPTLNTLFSNISANFKIISVGINGFEGTIKKISDGFQNISTSVAGFAGININSAKNISDNLILFTPGMVAFANAGQSSPMIMAGAAAMILVSESLKSMSNGINWNNLKSFGDTLSDLTPKLRDFGFSGILSAPGIALTTGVLSTLSNTIDQLSPSLDKATVSMAALSAGMEKFKSSVKGVDVSSLQNLSEMSNNFAASKSEAPYVQPITMSPVKSAESKELRPIKVMIDLKMNGRDLHSEIIEAHTYST